MSRLRFCHVYSAWLDVDDKGRTVQRCLHRGGCVRLERH